MMLDQLKKQVWRANLDLVKYKLVTLTWGNVSGINRKRGLVVIKPSGMSYEKLKPSDMVVVDLEGYAVEGNLKPSADTPIHLELYRAFDVISGVVHTHSEYATIFAQAYREIPCLGTTHADHFLGPVPVTRMIRRGEVAGDYERNTGKVIVERFGDIDPLAMPAVLVAGHGAFTWGRSPEEAVENSLILERVAKMAWGTLLLDTHGDRLSDYLLKKHYQRKHGPEAYYGQKKKGGKNE
jgi:L-ribulose-5-phosphate 4-epimerase